jgi:hypothetical protein
MKYIKQYEKVIAAKSERAKINPLYYFSSKIIKILKIASEFKTTRWFDDTGIIKIRSQPVLMIEMDYDERLDRGSMTVSTNPRYEESQNFHELIKTHLNSYLDVETKEQQWQGNYLRLKFSLKDTDDIIKRLEEEYTVYYLSSKKYNI